MAKIEPILNHQIKTALVYDRVNTAYGGAEQVMIALHQLFPQAPLYTSVYAPQTAVWAKDFKIKTSFLQKIPLAKSHHRLLLPLMPLAFEQLNLDEFELIISVSSAEAKAVLTKPHQVHINYLLSPPRYLYSHRSQYLSANPILTLPGINWLSSQLLDYLCWWDQAAIHRPDAIIPLSKLVKYRADAYYQDVETLEPIYPPADVPQTVGQQSNLSKNQAANKIQNLKLPPHFNLVVSRLVSYKRIDLVIQASQALNQPLVIVGSGPQLKSLKKLSRQGKTPILFLHNQPQPLVDLLLEKADLILSPGQDDFGLTALQANLKGTPAIINSNSGAAEVIIDGLGGIHLHDLTAVSLAAAINQASQIKFDSDIIKQLASNYTTTAFLTSFKNVVQTVVSNKIDSKL